MLVMKVTIDASQKKKLITEDSFFYYEGSAFMLMLVFKWNMSQSG